MPSKQPPAGVESSATQPSPESPIAPATYPAIKRFTIAVLLFGAWLMFLTYLAFLTWSGK